MWRPGWNISDFLTQGVTALIITALGNTRINPKNLHIEFAHWMFPSPITPRPWKCLFSEQTNWNLGFSHIKPFYELEGTMPLGILSLAVLCASVLCTPFFLSKTCDKHPKLPLGTLTLSHVATPSSRNIFLTDKKLKNKYKLPNNK